MSDEAYCLESQILLIVRGKPTPIDLMECEFEEQPGQMVYSFLALMWAMMSDIDLESEFL